MDLFMVGAIAMASFVAGLFFLKFWCDTKDRFFGIFAIAFWLLGMTRILLVFTPVQDAENPPVYWLRFFAFLLIVAAIVDKNRQPRRS